MKREFTNGAFEEFLKSSADDLRMRAPDKIWKNISKEIHKRRRRFIIGLSAALLVTSAISYYTISYGWKQTAGLEPQINSQPVASTNKLFQEIKASTRTTVSKPQNKTALSFSYKNNLSKLHILTAETTNETNPVQNELFNQTSDTPIEPNNFTPTVVDSYTEFENEPAINQLHQPFLATKNSGLPLTIESVLNTYKLKLGKNKIETQFHFTPTISYRKLTENKSYLRSVTSPTPVNYSSLYSSVNNNVTHKPDLGFELGVTAKYPITKSIKLRTGLQFNVNRYDIKAFSSSLEIATIALNTRSRVDSLNTISSYSNVNGYKSNWLQNLSFQVSVPVGIELTLPGSDKMQFGVATTMQPTYVLGDKAYLITTDYKNYTQVPWLTRRWNVNTALEAFVTYNTGKTKWQVGPQVRYQLLSSFISQYPVKENLFDFGLKIGVSLNK
jgi:hypothetical protein